MTPFFIAEKREVIMRKVCAAILSAAICLAVSGAPAWASEHQSTLSAGVSSCLDERPRQ